MTTRKRSNSLKLSTMLAGATALSLAGCDDPGSQASWDPNRGEQVEAFSYKSLEECKAANEVSDQQCDTSYAAAQKDDQKNAPRYEARASCEEVYGAGNCVPRTQADGHSVFGPLLAGFVIGRMLDGGGGYRGTGLYRRDDAYGGGYYSTWGGRLDRDYSTGRTVISKNSIDPPDAIRSAPPKIQTRTSVVSRGGFGGGRSYAHSGSFRGGFGG
jgi:uncharacterized protein YgiB involved in biofilm formation